MKKRHSSLTRMTQSTLQDYLHRQILNQPRSGSSPMPVVFLMHLQCYEAAIISRHVMTLLTNTHVSLKQI